MILGNAKWTLSFLHFILCEIFELADDFQNDFTDQEAFTRKRTHTNIFLPPQPSTNSPNLQ